MEENSTKAEKGHQDKHKEISPQSNLSEVGVSEGRGGGNDRKEGNNQHYGTQGEMFSKESSEIDEVEGNKLISNSQESIDQTGGNQEVSETNALAGNSVESITIGSDEDNGDSQHVFNNIIENNNNYHEKADQKDHYEEYIKDNLDEDWGLDQEEYYNDNIKEISEQESVDKHNQENRKELGGNGIFKESYDISIGQNGDLEESFGKMGEFDEQLCELCGNDIYHQRTNNRIEGDRLKNYRSNIWYSNHEEHRLVGSDWLKYPPKWLRRGQSKPWKNKILKLRFNQ